MTKRQIFPDILTPVDNRIDRLRKIEQERLQHAQLSKSKNFRDNFRKR